MYQKKEWDRIFSALITPMDAEEGVDKKALIRLVQAQLADGVEGFYCCGSSAEGELLTIEEREDILETVLLASGGQVKVIAHVGTRRTADVIRLAGHARRVGADAISMIPPYYYKYSMEDIMRHYESVIEAVPDIPVILYNIPQFTGVEFTVANAGRLLANDRVLGIKHTCTGMYALEQISRAFPDKIVFNGFDEQYLSACALGATAAVGTTVNVFAPEFKKIRSFVRAGKMEQALACQHLLNAKLDVMIDCGIFNAVKYIWTKRGVPSGQCRLPIRPLTDGQKQRLDALV